MSRLRKIWELITFQDETEFQKNRHTVEGPPKSEQNGVSNDQEKQTSGGEPETSDYARLSSRFFANVIDNIAITMLVLAPLVIAYMTDSTLIVGIGFVVGLFFGSLYLLILEWYWNGQTVGKKVLGIAVVTDEMEEIKIQHSLIRNTIGFIGQLFGAWGLIFAAFSIYMNDECKRLGDIAANTVVINK